MALEVWCVDVVVDADADDKELLRGEEAEDAGAEEPLLSELISSLVLVVLVEEVGVEEVWVVDSEGTAEETFAELSEALEG